MARRQPAQPPRWSEQQLDADREAALAAFIAERGREGTSAYRATFEAIEPFVRRLFEITDDLRSFDGEIFREAPQLLDAARYLGGPPVSADDLRTLVGGKLGRNRFDPTMARKVADVLRAAWDPIRFPWVDADRGPTESERAAAIAWTAGVWAIERLRTRRRTESSRRQHAAVVETLRAAGYVDQPGIQRIMALDELPRGTFGGREVTLAGAKCDVPVRLRDGRLLALECKVSNSALNSVKRLSRETGGKARAWQNAFGQLVITGAVLAGVYKLGNLVEAQNNAGVVIFWEHNLKPLRDFVVSAS